jgi:hypothetical protein
VVESRPAPHRGDPLHPDPCRGQSASAPRLPGRDRPAQRVPRCRHTTGSVATVDPAPLAVHVPGRHRLVRQVPRANARARIGMAKGVFQKLRRAESFHRHQVLRVLAEQSVVTRIQHEQGQREAAGRIRQEAWSGRDTNYHSVTLRRQRARPALQARDGCPACPSRDTHLATSTPFTSRTRPRRGRAAECGA